MFDQGNRRAEFIVHIQNKAAHVLFFLDVHPRHRFIQQQDRRLGGQRTGQFDPFLQAVGQTRHGRLADRLNLKEIDDLFGDFAVRGLFPLRLALPDRLPEHAGLHIGQTPRHDVVQHRHPFEQGDVLERACDPLLRHLKGFHRRTAAALVPDLAFLRHIEPADHVQHG